MKGKNNETIRNPQDIIDSTYNSRDFKIIEKTINPYVMPLDMIRDKDAWDSRHFYQEAWDIEVNKIQAKDKVLRQKKINS